MVKVWRFRRGVSGAGAGSAAGRSAARSRARSAAGGAAARADRLPPSAYFVTSAVFHYLGPAFAVLLFARIEVLGVAWLRCASAAVVFALWRRPWRVWAASSWRQRRLLLALGAVLGLMNSSFYLALDRLPLGTVGAIEFLGPVLLAAFGLRSTRNACALVMAVGGVWLLTDVHFSAEPLGLAFAFGNCALFVLYVVLGHRLAADGGASGIDRLGAAMLVAMAVVAPVGIGEAAIALTSPVLLASAFGVGVCSSVIPYVCDQLAMSRLPRATFALMLSLLPATAVLIGFAVLGQVPTWLELAGVALVIGGVAIHQERAAGESAERPSSRTAPQVSRTSPAPAPAPAPAPPPQSPRPSDGG
ncbi:EamA family transporter [Streptomyces bathyalis]|uniref:EamA family transporter n=1 Tax=Streptomyces bathyalis TaxID=2710756 RepID=A0A7T1TDC4_9ACTN|nr:EamA family transporter [Streptomyces bathyalis]QPP10789.1 EamA family transporter [Streptomyces bathyalis]